MRSVPERLLAQGRQPDQNFAPDELLYVRCVDDGVEAGHLLPAAIKFPDWSTNRSQYSEPDDVLFPNFDDWGIAAFKVEDIPPRIQIEQTKTYTFGPVHDPLPENYSHTEIRTFKEGNFDRSLKVPTTVKKTFRIMLAARTSILKPPARSARGN